MAAQQKSKKPGLFKRIGRFFAKSWSELKKVTWPTFSTVLKQLGCVLAIVVIVLAIVMLMDFGLQQLLILVRGGQSASSAIATLLGVL